MTLSVADFQRLRQEAEDCTRQAERLAGQLDSVKARIKAEFGCGSLEEAKQKLAKLQAESARLEKGAETELAEYEKEWKNS